MLSKVFERLVSVRLGRFVELSGVLPTTHFAYRTGLGTCDALIRVLHTLLSASESGQEARIVQIDFIAAFGQPSGYSLYARLCGYWRFCVVFSDAVPI